MKENKREQHNPPLQTGTGLNAMQGNKGFLADFRIRETFGYSTALDNSFDYPNISGSLERSTLAVIAKRSTQNLYGRVILQACSY